jgi:hypothetical protein
MSNEVKEPKMAPIENDYFHNGITDSRHPNFRWNGPVGNLDEMRKKSLTPAELQALRDAAPKPLPTFAERQREAARTGVAVKPGTTIWGKATGLSK